MTATSATTRATTPHPEAAAEFFAMRKGWLKAFPYQNPGSTWDVGIYVDGHYTHEAAAVQMTAHFQRWLDTILAEERP